MLCWKRLLTYSAICFFLSLVDKGEFQIKLFAHGALIFFGLAGAAYPHKKISNEQEKIK